MLPHRNHGLCASASSCRRFAAERSLGVSGLVSGTAKMRSSLSISAMLCSVSIRHNIYHKDGEVKRDGTNVENTRLPSGTAQKPPTSAKE